MAIVYRLAAGVEIETRGESLQISRGGAELSRLNPGSPAVRALLGQLAEGVGDSALEGLPAADAAGVFYIVEKLTAWGALDHAWFQGGIEQVVFRPNKTDFTPKLSPVPGQVRLSRNAYLRPGEQGWVLKTAEGACDALIRSPGVSNALLGRLTTGARSDDPLAGLCEIFWQYRFLEPADAQDLPAASWEFHDVLFHHASRGGNDRRRHGGTYRFRGRFPMPPAVVEARADDIVTLPEPVAEGSARNTFEQVLATRHSERNHDDDRPITLQQIASFLWRTVRFTGLSPDGLPSRRFPSGGSIHELEFYLAVRLCDGMEPGFYHYNGWRHCLERIKGKEASAGFVEDAARCWGQPDRLAQIVVITSSRLPRLAWKYEGMAYRVTVLNAGVVMQTMYLVATDMKLAGTALGLGNVDRFAAATGLDPRTETSVAEFALGSKRSDADA